jgi:mRNA interferase RelE/StbE
LAVRRYDLTFAQKAVRSLGKLDRQVAQRIREAAEALCDDPRPPGAKMLAGMHGIWRVRVAKDYRIVYQVDDGLLIVLVLDAGHRREIYR